jgi:tetratricopeptide (TPR) repeat protein
MLKNTIYIVFSLLFYSFCLAQTPQNAAAFRNGNTAYTQKNYTEAIANYEKINNESTHSPDLYYNLANAYAQNKQLGKAILNYERALRLAPFDADAAQNLSIVATWRKDDIETLQPFFLIRWAKAVRNALSSNTWASLGLCLLFAMSGGVFLLLFGNTPQRKKQGFGLAIASFWLALIPFWCAYETIQLQQNSGFCIVQTPEIVLHNAPDAESSDIMTLHEGTRVERLDQINDWIKVELPNSEQGWLPENAVEEI